MNFRYVTPKKKKKMAEVEREEIENYHFDARVHYWESWKQADKWNAPVRI